MLKMIDKSVKNKTIKLLGEDKKKKTLNTKHVSLPFTTLPADVEFIGKGCFRMNMSTRPDELVVSICSPAI